MEHDDNHGIEEHSRLILLTIVGVIENRKVASKNKSEKTDDGRESARERKAQNTRVKKRRLALQRLLGKIDRQKRRQVEQHQRYRGRFYIPQWKYMPTSNA